MQTQSGIEALAYSKLEDAEYLLEDKRFDNAYYLAGYAVELLLKARVCKTLGIPDFFDFDNTARTRLKSESVITKPYRVHDFEQLIILSGIYPEFQKEIVTNKTFRDQWSFISKWNENARYLIGKNPEDAKDFLTSIKEVMRWIQKHL
jgi:HEPN domain-containing protein